MRKIEGLGQSSHFQGPLDTWLRCYVMPYNVPNKIMRHPDQGQYGATFMQSRLDRLYVPTNSAHVDDLHPRL